MRTITVDLADRSYPILISNELLSEPQLRSFLAEKLSGKNLMVVADSNVAPLYLNQVCEFFQGCSAKKVVSAVFTAGEVNKTLGTVASLYQEFLDARLDRTSVICALGGGVTGDMVGFAAASYMRGVPFIQMPTSLMAFVDSSIGGKTGVDLPVGKNLVGAFHQPLAVVSDTSFLKTLPEREFRCGLAEVVKYAMIFDSSLLTWLEDVSASIMNRELELLTKMVETCSYWKARTVSEDEREKGGRALLNYGHTFGHAIEVLGEYSSLNHGEAVAIGMSMAADLSVELGMIEPEVRDRQERILERFGLPVRSGLPEEKTKEVLQKMFADKKVEGQQLRLVLLDALGHSLVVRGVDLGLIENAIRGRMGDGCP
jgi:3-dehydroquinate synthase